MGSGIPQPVLDLGKAKEQIHRMLAKDLAIAERAEDILMRIVSKNARVYETERAAPGLPAVAVYLACEE